MRSICCFAFLEFIQNRDECFLWNILFDKTTLTIASTLVILLPLS